MIGLYLHIPFCTQKCHYCNFVVTTNNAPSFHDDFLRALAAEMRHGRSILKSAEFDTVYLGGGTPSVLTVDETKILFDGLRQYFVIKPEAEITCEINPGDFDLEKAKNYYRLGVNRISLGAQSFMDKTLTWINRTHRAKDISRSFKILREAGFQNIGLDLMLSLPGETLGDVQTSLAELVRLGPEHVSLYELVVEEKTVFGHLHKKGKLELPDEDLEIEMLFCARETLKGAGFNHYELLNYAKPGFQSKHNRIYWDNEEYLGLGPGAFSYIGGRRFMFSSGVGDYLEKIKKGDWAPAEEEVLSGENKERESFLLALRLAEGAECDRFSSLIKSLKDELNDLERKDLLANKNGRIWLTSKGQFFAETVFSKLA